MNVHHIVFAPIIIFTISTIMISVIFPTIFPSIQNYNSTSTATSQAYAILNLLPIIVILAVIVSIVGIIFVMLRGMEEKEDYNEPVKKPKPNPYLTDMRTFYPNDNRVKELKKIMKKLKNVPDDMKDELLK